MTKKMTFKKIYALLLLLLVGITANAQVSGSVFRDFNGNGIKDTYEPLISGVTVNVYGTTGTLCGTATTSGNTAPNYTIPSACTGKVRVEFLMPTATGGCSQAGADFSALAGSTYGSSTQFVTAPASLVNYALYSPGDYNNGTAEVFHNVIYPSVYSTNTAASYDFTGNNYYDANVANIGYEHTYDESNTFRGSNWGLAYSRQAKVVFSAAVLVRGAMLGSLGTGGIYKMTPSTSTTAVTAAPFFNMDNNSLTALSRTRAKVADSTMFPYGEGSSYTLWNINSTNTWARGVTFSGGNLDPLSGSPVTMGVVGSNADRLPNTNASYSNFDPAAFDQVGKVGIGGLAISDDGLYLFVVNLYQKKIFRLTLDNAYNPQSVVAISSYNLPNIVANNGVLRPWAIKYYRGSLYVGAVATAENGGVNVVNGASDLFSYVLELPNATSSTLSASPAYNTVLTVPMNYDRGASYQGGGTRMWLPWQYNITGLWDMGHGNAMPQPILSAIDFSDNGDLVLGYLDRARIQLAVGGAYYLSTQSGDGAFATFGETLIAGKNCNGTYALESNGTYTTANGQTITNAGYNVNLGVGDNRGVGGGQFFTGDFYNGGVSETSLGSLGILKGQGQIIEDNRFALVSTGNGAMGTKRISTITGSSLQSSNGTQIGYNEIASNTVPGSKQGALTDIAMVVATPEAPIEIGNRVWNDVNGNGIQDPGEAGIGGVKVDLYAADGTTLVGSVITAADGTYYFSNATGSNTTGITYFNGATTGTTGLIPKTNYILKIDNTQWANGSKTGAAATPLAGLYNTLTNAAPTSGGVATEIDNNATLAGVPTIAYTTGISGTVDHSLDFGFSTISTATLGDKVWNDLNGNGIQDPGEPGVAGVTVTLYDNTGKAVATTVTDAYGKYSFPNLTPGTYTEGFTLPDNYKFTNPVNSGDNGNNTNSDVNIGTGRTDPFTLISGEVDTTADAGIIFTKPTTTATIGDRVWLDANGNGIQDPNEPGVSGVTVTLYDNTGKPVATTITDANGNYKFTNVPPGTYTVGVTPPVGSKFTNNTGTPSDATNSDILPSTGKTLPITVNAGDTISYLDAGLALIPPTKSSLSGVVWNDINHDGIQDPNEKGIAGVPVNLYGADGTTVIATTKTDAFGKYSFPDLTPGNYSVGYTTPTGYSNSPQNAPGSTNYNNSDPNATTGKTNVITLNPGDNNTISADAGMYQTAPAGTLQIGDKVWNDINKDGIQTADEPGVAGVMVTLYQNGPDGIAGTADDVVIGTTPTDANGNYLFTDLKASSSLATVYNVGFSNLPSGYALTPKNAPGSTSTTDSDPNPVTGRTGDINLTANNLTVDAGLVQGIHAGKSSLGDKVWTDLNGNGLQDAGELGVAGTTVNLYSDANNDGVISGSETTPIATTTTDALGNYLFTNLDAGVYQVGFSKFPAGYTLTPTNAGSNTALDNNGNPIATSVAGNPAVAGTSFTNLIPLAASEVNLTVDAGIIPPANTNTLNGTVWLDANKDGLQTAGEPGVKGVIVNLYDAAGKIVGTTTTDANGKYQFTGLPDGTYSTGFTNLPAGTNFTPSSTDVLGSDANTLTGRTPTVTLNAGNRNDVLDAGIMTNNTAALGDYVWYDANGDGVQDATEAGLSGVTVSLYRPGYGLDGIAGNADDALPVTSAVTDATGKYMFTNLAPGDYQVGFTTVPTGLVFTQQKSPGDNQNNTNSDVNPATGLTNSTFNLAAGEVDLTVDAGLKPSSASSIGDYVWYDVNQNGVQDATEKGVPGVLVTLYDANNKQVGSAITDSKGKYSITNIPEGAGYYVVFSNIPATASFTLQNSNLTLTDGTLGSDANNLGKTNTFTIAANTVNNNIDAGIYGTATGLPYDQLVLQSVTLKGIQSNLIWMTENEQNTAEMLVERSVDGQFFETVGTLPAAGNTVGVTNYTFQDDISKVSNNCLIIYHITATDMNGNAKNSNQLTLKLNCDNSTVVSAWPNPFTEQINVSVLATNVSTATVRIVDAIGKVVIAQDFDLVAGNNQLQISQMANLANGMYMLDVVDNNNNINFHQKFSKQ